MNYNVNKIYSFEVEGGVITSISVYIDDLTKYVALEGYEAPQTAYKIAQFNGEEAIFRVLKDIGFDKDFDLKLNQNDYETYILLSGFMSDDSRVVFNNKHFYYPGRHLKNIKKVVLNKDESINTVKLNFGESYGFVTISYLEYMFTYAVWSGLLSEKDLIEDLKKKDIVETHRGDSFNYYSNLESGTNKIIRRVVSSNGTTIYGVFLVNIADTLLSFRAIENGYNMTYKEEIPKDSVFYMSNCTISIMQ